MHRLSVGRAGTWAGAASVAALLFVTSPAIAQSPPHPTAAQPVLPSAATTKAKGGAQSFPVVESIVGAPQPSKAAAKPETKRPRRRFAGHHHAVPLDIERPALAGVLLDGPIPPRRDPPRPIVPTPAYFVDGIASAFTTPPPPVVCRRRPRDPDPPGPRLYREVPLVCDYDID